MKARSRRFLGAKVVWDKGFLGVVADKEWDAIQAAQKLKVEWSQVDPPFPEQAWLYDHIRKASVRKRSVDKGKRECRRRVQERREGSSRPNTNGHSSRTPAWARRARSFEIKDGEVTCWSGTQKSHFVQEGLALTLDLPVDKVRSYYTTGPGSYGRNDADDCALDAAVLAKAVGKPVRLQYMREQGTGWDPKGPASIHRARAALDASGRVIAYEFTSKGFSRLDVNTNGGKPHDTLCRTNPRRSAEVGRWLRRTRRILCIRQQAYGMGRRIPPLLDRSLAAAHRAFARSRRPADPLRKRDPSSTRSRRR